MKSLILVLWALIPAWAASAAISPEEEQRLQAQYSAYRGVDSDYVHAGKDALDRWMDWKWGLRIHWGLYCLFDGRESWIVPDHRQDKEWQRSYYASYQRFNPTGFDADEWMRIMERAGMKYFSFTTKHHEGTDLRFTRTKDKRFVYVISLKWPGQTLRTRLVKAREGSRIQMLGVDQDLKWRQDSADLVIDLPAELQDPVRRPCQQAYAFKVESEAWEKVALPGE